MKIKILSIFVVMLIVAIGAQSAEKIKNGFGASISATTTPDYITIEQKPNSDISSNGTFASSDYWVLGTDWAISGNAGVFTTASAISNGNMSSTYGWGTGTMWKIAGGKATFQTTEANTDELYQAFSCISGRSYTVQYTVAGIAAGSSFQPRIGTNYGTAVGTNGTYMESILCAKTGTNITFVGISGADSTQNIDNVIVRQTGLYETNDIYEVVAQLSDKKSYRVEYTISGMDTGTNSCVVMVGNNFGTTRTSDGTYIEDVPFGVATSSNLTFRGISTNISSFTIDNISIREKPEQGYVDTLLLSVEPTDPLVYVAYDCTAEQFTNMVAEGRTMIINSNNSPVEVNIGDKGRNIQKIWHQSSGSSTLTVNGY